MRIVYFSNFQSYGGGERYLVDLSLQSAMHHHEVHLIVRGASALGARREEMRQSGVIIHYIKASGRNAKPWEVLFKLVKILRRLRPDVLHINECRVGIIAAKLAGVRIVGTFHVPERFAVAGIRLPRRVDQLFVDKYDGIITISDHTTEVFKSMFHYSGTFRRIYVGQNLVRGTVKRSGIKRVVCVGRLDAGQKGQDLLLQAWARLDTLDRELWLVGSGPSLPILEDQCKSLGLKNVIFKGFASDAVSVINHADLVVVPSRFEGIPYVVLETMSTGTPIVATNVGGIPEAVNAECGFVCEPTIDSLERALDRAFRMSFSDVSRMASRGQEIIETQFSPEKMYEETIQLYREVMKGLAG